MQSLSSSQWIIIAIVIVLVAVASSLFTRALQGRKATQAGTSLGEIPQGGGAASVRRAAPVVDGEAPPIKGWLLVLSILIFLPPVVTGYSLLSAENAVRPDVKELFWITAYGVRVIYLAVLALEIAAIACLLRRSRSFVRVYVAASIAFMLLLPAAMLWVSGSIAAQTGRSVPRELQNVISLANVIIWLIVGIPTLIWLIYVLVSRRVAATFVR